MDRDCGPLAASPRPSNVSYVIRHYYDDLLAVLTSSQKVLVSVSKKCCEINLIGVETKTAISEFSGDFGPKLLLSCMHTKLQESDDYLPLILEVLKMETSLSEIHSKMNAYITEYQGTPGDEILLDSPASGIQVCDDSARTTTEALKLKDAFDALLFLLITVLSCVGSISLVWMKLLITPFFRFTNQKTIAQTHMTELIKNIDSPAAFVLFLTNRNLLGHLNMEFLNIFSHFLMDSDFSEKLDAYKVKCNSFFHQSHTVIARLFKEMPKVAPGLILDLPEIRVELQHPWQQRSHYKWKEVMRGIVEWPEYLLLKKIESDGVVVITYCVLPLIQSRVFKDLTNEKIIQRFSDAGAKLIVPPEVQELGKLESQSRKEEIELAMILVSSKNSVDGDSMILPDTHKDEIMEYASKDIQETKKLSDESGGATSSTSLGAKDGNSSFEITPSVIRDVVLKTKIHVTILPMLIILGGLPQSGKSIFMRQILQDPNRKFDPSPDVFSQHTIVASGFKSTSRRLHCAEVDHLTSHFYSFLSGILYYFRMEQLEPCFTQLYKTSDAFKDFVLNHNAVNFCNYVYNLGKEEKRSERLVALERALPKGLAVTPLWELTVNRTVLRFLECFRSHLFNSHVWLFVDLDRDSDKLHFPPDQDSKHLPSAMRWRSRLHYLLRSVCLSESCHTNRINVCRLFAIHKNTANLKDKLENLREEAENAAAQYGLSQLIDFEIIPLDVSSEHSCKTAYDIFLQYLQKSSLQQIPSSWIFFRSALFNQPSIFMPYVELCKLATECCIDVEMFLNFYSSFGSILNVRLVDKNSDYVIIDPPEFLRKLYSIFSVSLSSSKFGIFTPNLAKQTLGEEYETFFEILISVGLASKVSSDRLCGDLSSVEIAEDEKFVYYMSVVRRGESDEQCMPKAVQLFSGLKSPAMNMQIAFTNQVMRLLPEAFLVTCEQLNVTHFELRNKGSVKFVVQADVVEIRLQPTQCIQDMDNICSVIVKAAHNIAELRSKRGGEFRYHFRVICTDEKQQFSYSVHQKYHVLSDKLLVNNCSKCDDLLNGIHVYQHFKIALENEPIKDEFKLNEDISPEDAMIIANQINKEDVLAFSQLLFQAVRVDVLSEEPVSWQVSRLIMKWRAINKDYPKRALAKLLLKAAMSKDDIKQEQRDRFKQLARNVDIQFYSASVQHNKKEASI